jgi:phosphohistidine phosphatase SixA
MNSALKDTFKNVENTGEDKPVKHLILMRHGTSFADRNLPTDEELATVTREVEQSIKNFNKAFPYVKISSIHHSPQVRTQVAANVAGLELKKTPTPLEWLNEMQAWTLQNNNGYLDKISELDNQHNAVLLVGHSTDFPFLTKQLFPKIEDGHTAYLTQGEAWMLLIEVPVKNWTDMTSAISTELKPRIVGLATPTQALTATNLLILKSIEDSGFVTPPTTT